MMPELKESITKAYDRVMSKLGVESFVIQWNHAYTPSKDYKRHFHFVLTQTFLPISHAKMEFLPFPLRKFIITGPNYKPEHSKEYEDYINRFYTKFLVP
jgi:hypothetical protein